MSGPMAKKGSRARRVRSGMDLATGRDRTVLIQTYPKGYVEGLLKDIERLGKERETLFAENLVWRELMAEFRESVVQVIQAFPHGPMFDRIRRCMGNAEYMEAEVQKKLAEARERLP